MNEKPDLRIKKTYIALNKSFEDLLKQKDFDDITVNEICDNAMVGKATFYKHFSSKYDFLSFFMCRTVNECINKVFDEVITGNLYEYYKTFFDKFIDAFKEYNYNFKFVDNYTSMGIAFSPVNNAYNKMLNQLENCYSENNKINGFMAKYLSMALILIIFDFMQSGSHNTDETKESIYFLLKKMFA